MKDKVIQNKGPKYSEMLLDMLKVFDNDLSLDLSIEDTIDIAIEAYSLANRKEFLSDDAYKKELKSHNNSNVIEKMVEYKLKKYSDMTHFIEDYNIENNIFQVKTRPKMDIFNNILKAVVKKEK